jgi:voltage-gated potassium channel
LWVARLERWTDRPLTILALLLIPLLLAPYLLDLTDAESSLLLDADYLIWGLFALALVVPLIIRQDRVTYLRQHWVDALLVIIPVFGPLRAARAVRLVWVMGAVFRGLEGSRRLLIKKGTEFVLVGASIVVVVAAGLIVAVERDDPHATIRSYGDGLWWAMTTMATVGYGDKFPVTAAGRGIAVGLMLLGVAAFGLVTANLAALFMGDQEDEAKNQLKSMDERLRRIESVMRRRAKKAAQARRTRQSERSDTRRQPQAITRRTRNGNNGHTRETHPRDGHNGHAQDTQPAHQQRQRVAANGHAEKSASPAKSGPPRRALEGGRPGEKHALAAIDVAMASGDPGVLQPADASQPTRVHRHKH